MGYGQSDMIHELQETRDAGAKWGHGQIKTMYHAAETDKERERYLDIALIFLRAIGSAPEGLRAPDGAEYVVVPKLERKSEWEWLVRKP